MNLKMKMTYIEDVLDLARELNISAFTLTDILERRLAAGVALAWQLEQFTGIKSKTWLRAALPDAPDSPVFLAPPYDAHRSSALDLVKSAPNPAGRFWRSPNLEKYAAILEIPPVLLAHVISGSLRIKCPQLASRLALIIGVPQPRWGIAVLPDEHELWVRPPLHAGVSR